MDRGTTTTTTTTLLHGRRRRHGDNRTTDLGWNNNNKEQDRFWMTIRMLGIEARNNTRTGHLPLTPYTICTLGPGRGMEDEGGYKLLSEKIQIVVENDNNNNNNDDTQQQQPQEEQPSRPVSSSSSRIANNNNNMNNNNKNLLLCAIYSHADMQDMARTCALTWGYQCDGFLVFGSNLRTIPELGFVQFQHSQGSREERGEESYGNMWQKVRSIWSYIYQNYHDQYDFFHLGGDDMYVIPENLKYRLSHITTTTTNTTTTTTNTTNQNDDQHHNNNNNNTSLPLFMGQTVPGGGGGGGGSQRRQGQGRQTYVTGGPGYSLNRKGLELLVEQALPNCHVNKKASYEDRLITECLHNVGLEPRDSRDLTSGEQMYHGVAPHTLYTTTTTTAGTTTTSTSNHHHDGGTRRRKRKSFQVNAMEHWSQLPHPQDPTRLVGIQQGLESAAQYSVSFHNLYHPIYMARVHTILHSYLCP